ncbi:FPO subunit H [Methanosarcina barkeri str. Wiesmoor]|uniref:F(420)H(2) dehydrogenase subunit H n=2 Tax=Methanosarcina barkeri TaxID=2208 RepID=FPOH_METBF|nr:F420H2 dehydrogenase subunit FpoH [Methanosarcina barkeri]Q466B1.1 RecName: Full=F(420)H(2) dehydrogenase subunit H; AltName: Full=F(420)H(2)-dependent phenazine dehydrogenase subunit H; AltName: Full=F(420)H(2)-dependent phenazine oxidoreductase subunit H; Short=FPO subunit H [Methanosarcina barkeri str. Fusaro]AKB50579.1 FPO subunit H [Methanosarcina barkeri str. Wiesmoor]
MTVVIPEYITPLIPWVRGIVGLVLIGVIFMGAMGAVWLERKLSADIQTRMGPCRVGKYGLLQLVADAIKLFTKEDLKPLNADSLLFNNANIFMLGSVFLMLVALPVGAVFINGVEYPLAVTQMDISVLYIEAVSALSIFGIFMVAYGSNNKYSLLGAFRNFARMVGYEVPLGITVISVAAMTGSLNIVDISTAQGLHWNIFLQPLGCFVFFVSLMADMGRLPFDQNESEEELIAGWITEYCGMRFGLGFFAEYIHMILGSFLVALLFLGGWNVPGFIANNSFFGIIVPTGFLIVKVVFVLMVIIGLRWAVPRFRIDQVVDLSWKKLLPLALLNLVWAVGLGLYLGA